jgi:hypothetical protein
MIDLPEAVPAGNWYRRAKDMDIMISTCGLQPIREEPPSCLAILLDLVHQVTYVLKAALVAKPGDELDHQVTTIDVAVKVKDMRLDSAVAVVEAGANADVGDRLVTLSAEKGKHSVDPIGWYSALRPDLEVGRGKAQHPAPLRADDHLTRETGIAPQKVRSFLHSALAQ